MYTHGPSLVFAVYQFPTRDVLLVEKMSIPCQNHDSHTVAVDEFTKASQVTFFWRGFPLALLLIHQFDNSPKLLDALYSKRFEPNDQMGNSLPGKAVKATGDFFR